MSKWVITRIVTLYPKKLSRATGYASNLCGGEFPRRAFNNESRSGKEFIAILHYKYAINRRTSIAVHEVCETPVCILDKLNPINDRRVGGGAVKLESAHNVIRCVSCVNIELLQVLTCFGGSFVGNLTFSLGRSHNLTGRATVNDSNAAVVRLNAIRRFMMFLPAVYRVIYGRPCIPQRLRHVPLAAIRSRYQFAAGL